MNYKDINDYELIYHVRENDEYAYNTLINKYSFLVNKLAYEYYSKNRKLGIELEDLIQEGFFAISMSIKDYNQDASLFYTYVVLCIRREMERYIKYNRRNKQMILNTAISFNQFIDENNELLLEDVIESSYNLEDSVCNSDFFNRIFMYRYNFNLEESSIFELKFNQFSNKEIAILLDISYKKVDNCLRKIRNRLVKFKLTL